MEDSLPLTSRHGSAKRPDRDVEHPRPSGVSDDEVEALGKLSEALEAIEQARGFLYGFHRLSGTADRTLQEAVELFRQAGHAELADDIETCLVGRDVVDGRWTFQIVESYDAGYWSVFRDVERHAREHVAGLAPHVHEAEMKADEQDSVTSA